MIAKNVGGRRVYLLASAGTAAAAVMLASGVRAADTTVSPIPPDPMQAEAEVLGHKTDDAFLDNSAPVVAQITGTTGGVGEEATPTSVSTITVDGNDIHAVALGNNFVNTIALPTIANTEDGDGAGALGFAMDRITNVNSEVYDNAIRADLDDFQNGGLAVSANHIDADATGNAGSTLLSGSLPNSYASSAAGTSTITRNVEDADWLDASGSLVASTVQVNWDVDVLADAYSESGNRVFLDLISVGGNEVDGSLLLTENRVAANGKGNASTSAIDIAAGGAPTFTGSAVVTNGQLNLDDIGGHSIDASTQGVIHAELRADNVDSDINRLTGSLKVADNFIGASAAGNTAVGDDAAGNRIRLADGLSFAGNAAGAAVDTAYDALSLTSSAAADLVIHNNQGNTGVDGNRMGIDTLAYVPQIYADVQAIFEGEIAVSGNDVEAASRGNAASSAIETGDGVASFAGTAAVANQQTNLYTSVTADVLDSFIYANVGMAAQEAVTQSSVAVDDNRSAASAYGNQVSQLVSLKAAALDLPLDGVVLTGGTGPDGNVSADGNVVVTNLQGQYSANVLATQSGDIDIAIDADQVERSELEATGNTQEALALGNSAASAIVLNGTGLTAGAGIASVQIIADDSAVEARASGATYIRAHDAFGSTVDLTGNTQRAIGYGNSAGNSLTVEGETLTVAADADDAPASTVTVDTGAVGGFVLDNSVAPVVDAAYGLLNDQSVSADIDVRASGYEGGAAFGVYLDHVDQTEIANDGNLLVAAGYGNEASNAAKLDVGNVSSTEDTSPGEPDFASVLNLTSAQTLTAESTLAVRAGGINAIETRIGQDDVDGFNASSVSTSDNAVQALAYGNRVGNTVTVDATNIDTEADSFPGGTRGMARVEGGIAQSDASFGLTSVQAAAGTIEASLLDEGGANTVLVLTEVATEVFRSSIASDGNALSSGATGNRADNLLDLAGNELATTGALTNFQLSEAAITSSIGVGAQTLDYWITSSGNMCSGEWCLIPGSVYDVVSISRLSDDQYDYLLANGWTVVGSELRRPNTDLPSIISLEYAEDLGNAFLSYSQGGAGLALEYFGPLSERAGVTVLAGGELIEGSTISVDGNTIAGSVTGNSAANAVKAAGTNVADGSDHLASWGTVDGNDTTALGDLMLTNEQIVGERALTSVVYGTFSIQIGDGTDIAAATMSVDDNGQSSRAVANTVANEVSLDATNTAAGTALVSNQSGAAAVAATSVLDIVAPAAATSSSLTMSGNTNLALGVMNNASNSMTIAGTNIDPVTTASNARLDVDTNAVAMGDHVLLNRQSAVNSVTANAVTEIRNSDSEAQFDSIDLSSVTLAGNATVAEASANRAFNTVAVEAAAALNANAGLLNSQTSEAAVSAAAAMSAGIALNGNDGAVAGLQTGGVAVTGNSVRALAQGNLASNALNYGAGAGYAGEGGFVTGASISLDGTIDAVASAQAAVLNVQSNTGTVTASSIGAGYSVELTPNIDSVLMVGSSVSVAGNAIAATAQGNSATNVLTVTALNSGVPSAGIGSYQVNTAAVTATVASVMIGVRTGYGPAEQSSIAVTGNAITATAIGNTSASAIAAAR